MFLGHERLALLHTVMQGSVFLLSCPRASSTLASSQERGVGQLSPLWSSLGSGANYLFSDFTSAQWMAVLMVRRLARVVSVWAATSQQQQYTTKGYSTRSAGQKLLLPEMEKSFRRNYWVLLQRGNKCSVILAHILGVHMDTIYINTIYIYIYMEYNIFTNTL